DLMISTKLRDLSDAPPISPPSTSAQANSSGAFVGLQLPPYSIDVCCATSSPYFPAICFLITACISCACSVEAVFPVPMAQIGSYAITILPKSSLLRSEERRVGKRG